MVRAGPRSQPLRQRPLNPAQDALSSECRRRQVAQRILSVRTLREVEFGSAVLCEPGFDLLLNIYILEASGGAASLENLLPTAGVPASVAIRWLKVLHSEGLLATERGQAGDLEALVELTSVGRDKLDRFLDCVEGFVARAPA
jgi:hypothetical protein